MIDDPLSVAGPTLAGARRRRGSLTGRRGRRRRWQQRRRRRRAAADPRARTAPSSFTSSAAYCASRIACSDLRRPFTCAALSLGLCPNERLVLTPPRYSSPDRKLSATHTGLLLSQAAPLATAAARTYSDILPPVPAASVSYVTVSRTPAPQCCTRRGGSSALWLLVRLAVFPRRLAGPAATKPSSTLRNTSSLALRRCLGTAPLPSLPHTLQLPAAACPTVEPGGGPCVSPASSHHAPRRARWHDGPIVLVTPVLSPLVSWPVRPTRTSMVAGRTDR